MLELHATSRGGQERCSLAKDSTDRCATNNTSENVRCRAEKVENVINLSVASLAPLLPHTIDWYRDGFGEEIMETPDSYHPIFAKSTPNKALMKSSQMVFAMKNISGKEKPVKESIDRSRQLW